MVLTVGSIFRHFKGQYYIIEGFAKDANSQKNLVIYRALYGNKQIWARTVKDFISKIDQNREDNVTGQQCRFEEVSEIV